jgi:hypothetical protein
LSDPTPESEAESTGDSEPAELTADATEPMVGMTQQPAGTPEPTSDSDAGQTTDPTRPNYKGAPLDAEAGPGLGCFWIQVGLLIVLLVLTPLTVIWSFPAWVSAALLILTLVILFFVGMTMVFLLRLVAADRRAQRRPLREGARKTVGQLENEAAATSDAPATATAADQSEQDDSRPNQG